MTMMMTIHLAIEGGRVGPLRRVAHDSDLGGMDMPFFPAFFLSFFSLFLSVMVIEAPRSKYREWPASFQLVLCKPEEERQKKDTWTTRARFARLRGCESHGF